MLRYEPSGKASDRGSDQRWSGRVAFKVVWLRIGAGTFVFRVGMRFEVGELDLCACAWCAELFLDGLYGRVVRGGRRAILVGAIEGGVVGEVDDDLNGCGRENFILVTAMSVT